MTTRTAMPTIMPIRRTAPADRLATPADLTSGPGLRGVTGADDLKALSLLAAWFSPAYPVGSFAYSHGLEAAVAKGCVDDAGSLRTWLANVLEHGAGWNDAVLMAAAFHAPGDAEIADLARSLAGSAERLLETEKLGRAFAEVTTAAYGQPVDPAPFPVAAGRAVALHGLPLLPALALYLQTFASNLVTAGVKLVPLGQTDGQRVLAQLLPICETLSAKAAKAGLDAIGGAAIRAEIDAMQHETQPVRLYRT